MEKVNTNLNIDNFSRGWRSSFNLEGDTGQVLAINPNEILDQSWFHRDDFSDTNMTQLMNLIMAGQYTKKITFPQYSTEIRLWAKSLDIFAELAVWVVLIDSNEQVKVVSLGKVKGVEWNLLNATIPEDLTGTPKCYRDSVFSARYLWYLTNRGCIIG
ncbi:MAG: hypothetical protein CM1200mP37_7810 [Chloroflexota bacterium]|nr:MAG: hypothetical protein CM1200mP37_7810 [Chloroflexota bacterium]